MRENLYLDTSRRLWIPYSGVERPFTLPFTRLTVLLIAHLFLGFLVCKYPFIATFHAWGILALGLAWVLLGDLYDRIFLVAAYISGAEVLWRMSVARVFWEFGKYATVLVLLAYVVRKILEGKGTKLKPAPMLYFLLLLPSSLITVWDSPVVRQDLSFNLSGPLSLAVCALVFSQFKLDMKRLYRILLVLLLPVISIGARAFYMTYINREFLTFGLYSNPLTSGGFGPNQVSAALGLGALAALLLAILDSRKRFRSLFGLISIWLLAQAFLTFSRGGVLNFLVAVLFLCSQYVKDQRSRKAMLGIGLSVLLVFNFLVFPKLNQLTRGELKERFTETNATGRFQIVKADLELFLHSPVYGVGPGMAKYKRAEFLGEKAGTHTEFTRLLAEHGVLGVGALILFFMMGIQGLRKQKDPLTKGLALAFWAWSMTEMGHSAMRIVAISFIFALSQVQWVDYVSHWKDRYGPKAYFANCR